MNQSQGVPPVPPTPGGGQMPGVPGAPQPPRIETRSVQVKTEGNGHMMDLTPDVSRLLNSVEMSEGQVTVFVPGSTAAISTIEFEPGLQKDMPEAMERIAPEGERYHHNETWHDGNGHSHVRSTLMGPSITVPFSGGRLLTGTWQQIVLLDWDNRGRHREVVLQFIGI
jgi:secondary thiamine-phosphate synthase enzyme